MPELQSPPLGHGRISGSSVWGRISGSSVWGRISGSSVWGRSSGSSVRVRASILALLAMVLVGCSSFDTTSGARIDAAVTMQAFTGGEDCQGAFVPKELEHTTTGRGVITAMSDGTGAGVLLEDLDDDGLVDVVLPNLSGETSVLWNLGELTFMRQPLITGRIRQAIAADIDNDGNTDVLLTTGLGPPISMIADAESVRSFTRQEFRTPAVTYSAAITDLAGNGSLQVLTGSYNAELTQNRDPRALSGNGVGIAMHDISGSTIATEFLADRGQALVTMAADLDDDGFQDVFVGNDLGTPDAVWLGTGADLIPAKPFDTTTLSTMSIDVADLDNDGDSDVIATDMAPMAGEDPEPWRALASDIESAMIDDVQEPRNKLQIRSDDGYQDKAADFGVDATGWSWSGIAGDLDNDGLLDLYVVNGMQATSIFTELPDGLLIEENQAFRNTGGGMEPAPQWGLAQTEGGRGMAQADMDNDGDLDVVINNLGQPSVLLENRICGGASLIVDPVWSAVQNADALGSTITVTTGDQVLGRQILSNRGYLSSPPTEAHIGLGEQPDPVDVKVTWPDGAVSVFEDVQPNQRLIIERTEPPTPRSAP